MVAATLMMLPCLASAAAAPEGSPSKTTETGDQIVVSGTVRVESDEVSGDIVVLHGAVTVLGEARGDVVILDGPVTIRGVVRGDVVAARGPLHVMAGARIDGDVWLAKGRPDIRLGSLVRGEVRRGGWLHLASPSSLALKLAVWIAVSFSTLVLGLLLLLLAPRGADAIHGAARSSPVASGAWGLGVFIGLPILATLLAATLVGLPFALGLLLCLAFLYSVGYVWTAWIVGRLLVRGSRHGAPRRILAFLAGWGILRLLGLIPYAGGFIWLLASALGLGAMSVATWRARRLQSPPRGPASTAGTADTLAAP